MNRTMNKGLKNFLVLAGGLIVAGLIVAGIGFGLGGMRPVVFTSSGFIVEGSEGRGMTRIDESYSKVTDVFFDIDAVSLRLVEGDSFSLRGTYQATLQRFEVVERNGVLTVTGTSLAKGWWGFGFLGNRMQDELTLTYPKGARFKGVDVALRLGSLGIQGLEADSLRVQLDLGDFQGRGIRAESMSADLKLGNCDVRDVTAGKQASFSMDSGSLYVKDSSVKNLTVVNRLGDVGYSGTLEGFAKAELDLGSLTFDLANKEGETSYRITADLGSIRINGRDQGTHASSTVSSPACTLDISLSLGSAELNTR
ncbi:MAG: DUF4097 domain-containing protein [Eggerthellaceae bacterium]|jgi:hypothetical protein|nr:DUF4097 domain-containing protein [Eggerthellaceae bacterium]MDR2715996.1 DUF4097 domain-containing protein [Coriobacteriaceae bacterium]